MGKTRNTGKLATQIQFDNSNNLVIGNSTSSSFNTSGSVNAIGGITGSIFGIGDPTSFSASISSDLVNLESKSASVDITIGSINSKTGSYATTGSNSFFGTQVFSGSVFIANDLVVQGSSSIQYISASSVSIGTNIVQLNTANPSVRYAGLTIIDSGSIGGSGSFLYDSVQDEFIFVHRGNGTNVTSSHFVLGPETFDNLGNETYLTSNIIPKGTGKEHLIDSCIFDNGTTTCIKNNLIGTGTTYFVENVGIGITSPAEKIHVFGNCGATSPRILIQSHDTANATAGLTLYGRDASNVNKVSEIVTSGCDLTISVNSAERMRITSAGNVGIGTCTPSSSLVIRSALPRIEISSTNYDGSYKSFFGSLITAQGILQFGNNSDNYILAGNTSAGGKLQFRVNVNDNFGYTCGLEAFTIHCDTSVCFAGPVKLAGAYASCLGLGTTTSPAKYLHIQGTNNFTQGIRFSEVAGGYPHNIYFGSPDSSAACWGLDFQVATTSATSATVLSLRGNCRVGINTTTPCSALHIVDSSANATTLTIGDVGEVPTIKAGGTNTDLRIEAVGGGGYLEFVTNGTNRFRTVGTGETTFTCQICTPGISITSNPIGVEYLIIAGGGGGGWDVGGGGGAGGVLNGSTGIWPGTYNIGIGAGGAGKTGGGGASTTQLGYNTYAIGLLAVGGGGGGNYSGGWGSGGGSGGGGAGYGSTTNAGFGMKGQGFEGGCGINVAGNQSTGGAGGGAGGVGPSSINSIAGSTTGGVGIISTIIGEHRSYGCGGRGGGDSWTGPMYNGTTNTGGGGDGAGSPNEGCSGGSGIVILKMKNTNSATFSGGLTTYTCTNVACYNIYVVTAGAGTVTIS